MTTGISKLFSGAFTHCLAGSPTLEDLDEPYPVALDAAVVAAMAQPGADAKAAAMAAALPKGIPPPLADAIAVGVAWNPVPLEALAAWDEACFTKVIQQPRLQQYPQRGLQLTAHWAKARGVDWFAPHVIGQVHWNDVSKEFLGAFLLQEGIGHKNGPRHTSKEGSPAFDHDVSATPDQTRVRIFADAPLFIAEDASFECAVKLPAHAATTTATVHMSDPHSLTIENPEPHHVELPDYNTDAPVCIHVALQPAPNAAPRISLYTFAPPGCIV